MSINNLYSNSYGIEKTNTNKYGNTNNAKVQNFKSKELEKDQLVLSTKTVKKAGIIALGTYALGVILSKGKLNPIKGLQAIGTTTGKLFSRIGSGISKTFGGKTVTKAQQISNRAAKTAEKITSKASAKAATKIAKQNAKAAIKAAKQAAGQNNIKFVI